MTTERTETFAQLIARLKAHYQVAEPAIAEAIGASVSAVNTWANAKRGAKQGPRREFLQRLAEVYPHFTPEEIFAAAGRQAPGPIDPDAEQRLLEYFRGLTAEQKRTTEILARALNESNQTD